MRNYELTITGKTPLLMHWDNIPWADKLAEWRSVPENKKLSKAGEDRVPAFTWIGSLYHNGSIVTVPSDNIMRCLMEGGAMVPVPGGKNGKTFKAQTQSGMLTADEHLALHVDGKTIDVAPLLALEGQSSFAEHVRIANANGFSLFVKRAKIGASKHVRVRPRFDRWELRGQLSVWDEQITARVLGDILAMAGDYKGLGDWRPSSKTPGPFGRFTATVKEVK